MYFEQLGKLNVNIRVMKILHCDWKSKCWNVASVSKYAHVAIKKKTFGPRFLHVRKSVRQNLMYRFSLNDARNIIIVNNDSKLCYGVHYLLTVEEYR